MSDDEPWPGQPLSSGRARCGGGSLFSFCCAAEQVAVGTRCCLCPREKTGSSQQPGHRHIRRLLQEGNRAAWSARHNSTLSWPPAPSPARPELGTSTARGQNAEAGHLRDLPGPRPRLGLCQLPDLSPASLHGHAAGRVSAVQGSRSHLQGRVRSPLPLSASYPSHITDSSGSSSTSHPAPLPGHLGEQCGTAEGLGPCTQSGAPGLTQLSYPLGSAHWVEGGWLMLFLLLCLSNAQVLKNRALLPAAE